MTPETRTAIDAPTLQRIVTRLDVDETVPLEEMLLTLARYGKPRVSLMGNGWYCATDMHVSSVGVEFKVASEFGHTSPGAAAAECCARVRKTLQDLGA